MRGRVEALVEALPQAAVLASPDGAVTAYNAPAAQLFPYLRAGQPLSFAMRDPDLLAAVAATAKDRQRRRLEIVERLPVERAFAAHVGPVNGEGTLLVFDDLTASRSLERMRVDFVANASHELRTPLASLLGFVETLRGPARDDAQARERFLAIMEVQARRMARLIDDLLSLSRIELNAHVRPTGRVDIATAVRQIADALRPLAEERDTSLALDLPTGEVNAAGDRDELLRVFENLIENAIKYGRQGGHVTVSLSRRAAGEVVAEVADDGPGVAAEHLPRLTERFYRVSVAASRDAGGTGLGLAIVKHILARHRGRLEIESTLGRGSTFRVVLPAADG